MLELLKPKTVQIKTQDGDTREFIVSRIPAVPAREILTQYPISAVPKLGDYAVNQTMMLKLIGYTAVIVEGREVRLTSQALIDNHVPDWETLAKLELEALSYNTSFFVSGKASTFFAGLGQKAQALISSMLTDFLAQSSKSDTPPGEN